MKVVIIGPGGVGGFIGGALAKHGQDVALIGRGKHLDAIRSRGLTIDSVALGKFQADVKTPKLPSDVGTADLIIFCVKTYDTKSALQDIKSLIGDETTILSLQNGIDNAERISDTVGKARVISGSISIESFIAEPGYIKQTSGPMRFAIGEITGETTSRVTKISSMLSDARLKCELSNQIQEILWEKFLFICAAAGVCSLTRSPIGDVMACQQTRELYGSVMKEVEAVARVKGVNLASDIISRTMTRTSTLNKSMKPSMLRDLELGKRLEIDALNGAVAALGHQLSIPTPVNDFIYAALSIHDLKTRMNVPT